jgi:hypothetical protein
VIKALVRLALEEVMELNIAFVEDSVPTLQPVMLADVDVRLPMVPWVHVSVPILRSAT